MHFSGWRSFRNDILFLLFHILQIEPQNLLSQLNCLFLLKVIWYSAVQCSNHVIIHAHFPHVQQIMKNKDIVRVLSLSSWLTVHLALRSLSSWSKSSNLTSRFDCFQPCSVPGVFLHDPYLSSKVNFLTFVNITI